MRKKSFESWSKKESSQAARFSGEINFIRDPPVLKPSIIEWINSKMSTPGREHTILAQIFAHWYGWVHLQMSLIEIKEEARKPRELIKLRK